MDLHITPPEHRMSAKDHAEVFRNAIEGPALRRTEASRTPYAYLLGGQPGSGKSTFARMFSAQVGSLNYVHVDVDRLRPLHPAYFPLVVDPATELGAPAAVQRDCSRWADQMRDSAIAGKRNMLLESTMRSPSQIRESSHALRNAGYATEARVMAVHPIVSEVSLLVRYEHEKRALGFGRAMPLDYHNLAASGLVESVAAIEADKLVDRLQIVDRLGNIVYENHLVDGKWVAPTQGARAIEAAREASLDVAERRNVLRLWNEVLDMMERRCATAADLQAVEQRRDATQRSLAALGRATQGGKAHLSSPGDTRAFNGKILEVNGLQVVQKIGRGADSIARHDIEKLTRIPEVGEVVDIRYAGDKAHVSERAHGHELGR